MPSKPTVVRFTSARSVRRCGRCAISWARISRCITLESMMFVRMAHSIPDAAALAIEAEEKLVVHTGDYKLDHTPVDGQKTDVGRLAELGNRGVDLMLGDSTNAERPGVTPSERVVGEAFRQIFPLRSGRILVSSFASNVHRMQQAIDVAVDHGRKVAIVGRSMRKNANIA